MPIPFAQRPRCGLAKGQNVEGFDEKIIAMYERGTSARESQGFLLDQYKVEVSPDFTSG